MTKVKVIDREIITTASVKAIADAYRSGISQRLGGIWRVPSSMLDWDFFTPDSGNDPFRALDTGPKPTFSVGSSYGLRGTPSTNLMKAVSAGVGGVVMLTVWDEDTRRRAELRHMGDCSPVSKKHVENIIARIRDVHPGMGMTQTDGKINI